ncbi:hypothetical protein B7990_07845 [Fibrobacter sp. UWB4]|nr:hypothetical protein B7990_07845 [Fibrobacter sp. UWB4]
MQQAILMDIFYSFIFSLKQQYKQYNKINSFLTIKKIIQIHTYKITEHNKHTKKPFAQAKSLLIKIN